jgi:hypothetical protein
VGVAFGKILETYFKKKLRFISREFIYMCIYVDIDRCRDICYIYTNTDNMKEQNRKNIKIVQYPNCWRLFRFFTYIRTFSDMEIQYFFRGNVKKYVSFPQVTKNYY